MSKILNDFAHSELFSSSRGDLSIFDVSKTRQEFADECDINTLMSRYEHGGALSHVNQSQPFFIDMTSVPDMRGAMDAYRIAGESFAALPAKVRREFDNDPQLFVDFAQNPDNLERMREWGLAPPIPVADAPIRVELVPQPLSASIPLPELPTK